MGEFATYTTLQKQKLPDNMLTTRDNRDSLQDIQAKNIYNKMPR